MINTDKIAMEYALSRGYDSIRKIGLRRGYIFYEYYKKKLKGAGYKLGLGHYLKISHNGIVSIVTDYEDKIWGFNN